MRDPDIYADPGTIVAESFLFDDVDTFLPKIREVVMDAGWSQISAGTAFGHPTYELLSARSPWWNELASPPAGYKARVRMRIRATTDNEVRFRISNEAADINQNAAYELQLSRNDSEYLLLGYPYQFTAWVPGFFSNFTHHCVIISALNTPQRMQENGLEECIFASEGTFRRALHTANPFPGNSFLLVKNADGTFLVEGGIGSNYGPRFIIPVSQAAGATPPAIANAREDPTGLDDTLWFPLVSPPQVAWGDEDLGSTLEEGSVKIRGWLWGCKMPIVSCSDPYTQTAKGMTWDGYTSGAPATLMFRTA